MKKLLALFLCALALFSLSACTTQADVEAAYQRGFDSGYNKALSTGYDDGYAVGYNEGYDIGCADTEPVAYDEGQSIGYKEGYIDGFDAGSETFEQGYALGYDQSRAIIDADISQSHEYKSWAKSYPQLNQNKVSENVRRLYDSLHITIDSWHNELKKDRNEKMQEELSNGFNIAIFEKYELLQRAADRFAVALHNMVDNMMFFENSHRSAEEIFWSGYNALETALTESGVFEPESSYDTWLANHPALQTQNEQSQ